MPERQLPPLKYGEVEFTEDEQKKIDKWINSSEERKRIFQELKSCIEFQKQLSVAEGAEVKEVLRKLKEVYPQRFSEVSEDISYWVLSRTIKCNLDQISGRFCYDIVYKDRWIMILAFVVRLIIGVGIILLAILICRLKG